VNQDKYVVTFAGSPGSSKSPIAYFLSYTFGFPIYNNDAVRTEVTEDFLSFDEEEYKKRRDARIHEIIQRGESFILDASIDREWKNNNQNIEQSGYKVFIISMDLSKEFLLKLYKAKGYTQTKEIDRFLKEHKDFLLKYRDRVNVHITDENFSQRLRLCAEKLREWL
jgi:hypothetical protein